MPYQPLDGADIFFLVCFPAFGCQSLKPNGLPRIPPLSLSCKISPQKWGLTVFY